MTSEKEQQLKKENESLQTQMKELEAKFDELHTDFLKSTQLRNRFESLCTELQNQAKQIKAENSAKIKEAEAKGLELAIEVSGNVGYMETINENLKKATGESFQARKENENLAKEIATMKEVYDKREVTLKEQLKEQSDKLVQAKTELAQIRLRNAVDKEKQFGEMQKLATSLVQSREEMKATKESELSLRLLIQNYEEKFTTLHGALKQTNAAYDGFKGEMEAVCSQTKELEQETTKWQSKWEESNATLAQAEEKHLQLQTELQKNHVGLTKLSNLYKALQGEQEQLLKQLKQKK